jgi:hypothetical protein
VFNEALLKENRLKVMTLVKSLLVGCAIGLLPAIPWNILGGQLGDRISSWVNFLLLPGVIVDYPFGGVHGMNIWVVQVSTCCAYVAAAYWWLSRRGRKKKLEL